MHIHDRHTAIEGGRLPSLLHRLIKAAGTWKHNPLDKIVLAIPYIYWDISPIS